MGGLVAGLALSGATVMPSVLLALRPLAWHLLTVGWVTQLIFGVAFWMFSHAAGSQQGNSVQMGWWVFLALNIGLVLRAIGEPLAVLRPMPINGLVLPLAATAQLGAMLLFVLLIWPRVRPPGSKR